MKGRVVVLVLAMVGVACGFEEAEDSGQPDTGPPEGCTPDYTVPELCNGVDDDCDGRADGWGHQFFEGEVDPAFFLLGGASVSGGVLRVSEPGEPGGIQSRGHVDGRNLAASYRFALAGDDSRLVLSLQHAGGWQVVVEPGVVRLLGSSSRVVELEVGAQPHDLLVRVVDGQAAVWFDGAPLLQAPVDGLPEHAPLALRGTDGAAWVDDLLVTCP